MNPLFNHPIKWNKGKELVALLCLGICLFFLYRGGLEGEYISDDITFIEDNPKIEAESRITNFFTRPYWFYSQRPEKSSLTTYYRPLVLISLYLDYQIHGGSPRGFRITNILLLFLFCISFYCFLTRVLEFNQAFSLLSTLLLAFWPIHSVNVCWVVGRNDLLYLLFGFAFLTATLDYLRSRRIISLGMSLLFFVTGLFSKESFLLFIPLLIFLMIGFLPRCRRNWLALTGHLGILTLYAILRSQVAGNPSIMKGDLLPEGLIRILSVTGFYIRNSLVPFLYQREYQPGGPVDPVVLIMGILFYSLLAVAIGFCWKRREFRDLFFVSALWFFLLFFSGLSLLHSTPPSLRLMSAAVPALAYIVSRLLYRTGKILRVSLSLVVLLLFSGQILFDISIYRTRSRYYSHLAATHPRVNRVQLSHIRSLIRRQRFHQALRTLDHFAGFHRPSPTSSFNISLIKSDLARESADYTSARYHLAEAERLGAGKEEESWLLFRRVNILKKTGHPDMARTMLSGFHRRVPELLPVLRKIWEIDISRLEWQRARAVEERIQEHWNQDTRPSAEGIRELYKKISSPARQVAYFEGLSNIRRALEILPAARKEMSHEAWRITEIRLLFLHGKEEKALEKFRELLSGMTNPDTLKKLIGLFDHRIFRPELAREAVKKMGSVSDSRRARMEKYNRSLLLYRRRVQIRVADDLPVPGG